MNKARILVCDDDQGILEVIKIILEESNYEVMIVSTGKGIQKVIRSYKPNILFLDIWMPQINGKEITKILKRDPQTKDIPVVVISALDNTKQIAAEIGADAFLPKPFTIQDLLGVINKQLTN